MTRSFTSARAMRKGFVEVFPFFMVCFACDFSEQYPNPLRANEITLPCDESPPPRWVLRDKDGVRISAMVEPRCGDDPDAPTMAKCTPQPLGVGASFPCVRIIDYEGRFVNLQYELASGKMGPCQGVGSLDPEDTTVAPQYLTDDCSGEKYVGLGLVNYGLPEFTTARNVFYALGQVWYGTGDNCVSDPQVWVIDSKTKECTGPKLAPSRHCPLRPVPDWVQNLLANPPYTLAVEYE